MYSNENIHGGDIYNHNIKDDFSVNINPLGTPYPLKDALREALEYVMVYPQQGSGKLTAQIAANLNPPVEKSQVLCGNGASELLAAIVHAIRPKKVVIPVPSFYGYEWAAQMVDAHMEFVQLKENENFAITETFLDVLREDVDLLFLASPANPVGNEISREMLQLLLKKCKDCGITVVLDECFIEFAGDAHTQELLHDFKNLIIVRAFTKIYGIPGVRLGYLIADSHMRARIARQLPEWNLSVFAQAAGVIYEKRPDWDAEKYLADTRNLICREREYLINALNETGKDNIRIYDSVANYILFYTEAPLYDRLLKEGILIRDCSNYRGLGKGYYRIAVKDHASNERLMERLRNERT